MIIDSGIVTGSLQVSGSFSVQGEAILTGGLVVTGGITGSISGSSATAVSASYATTAGTAINAPYYVLTASYNADSASVSTRVTNLESWSSSLDSGFVTEAELAAATASLQAGVTASINQATASLMAAITSSANTTYADLQAGVTASIAAFATTGSNTFTGTNNFNIVSASYIQALSASIDYLSVVYQTSSIVYSSGSNQLGDGPGDTQTLYGTVDIKNGPVLVSGSMNVATILVAATASILTASVGILTASVVYGSGSSQFGNLSTDSTTFYGLVDIKNGPVYVTGSMNVGQRITAGELTVLYGITGSLNGTASIALDAISASRAVSALNADTASYVAQAQTASFVQQAQNAFTASYVETAQTASYVFQAQNAFTASYVEYAQNAFTASYVTTAQSASYVANAQTASYVTFAQTASYVTLAQTASFVQTAQTALTASYVQQAQTALTASYIENAVSTSLATRAILADTASSADSLLVRNFLEVGGPGDGFHQLYVTTSISDGTLGLDSSGDVNALYFLKGGVRKLEISVQVSGSTPITQILPYSASSVFRIGNPSNASDNLIFVSEPVNGNILLGPGITTGSYSLSGSQPTDKVQFTGDTFVSGALTTLNNIYTQGTITSTGGFSGSLSGNANTATTAVEAPYYVLTASYSADSSSFSTRVTDLEATSSVLIDASASFVSQFNNISGITGSYATTGSNTFIGNQTIGGNIFLSASTSLIYNNNIENTMLFGFFDGSNIYGPYYQIFGRSYSNASQRGGAEFIYDVTDNADANFHIASFNGSTWTQKFLVNDNGAQVTGSLTATAGFTGSLSGTATNAVTASILQNNSATVNSSTAVYTTGTSLLYNLSAFKGAMIDYVVSTSGSGDDIRGGTFTAVWNAVSSSSNEVTTMDIGNTDAVQFTADATGSVFVNVTSGSWVVDSLYRGLGVAIANAPTLFTGTVDVGSGGVCTTPEATFTVTGDAANFCDCTQFSGAGFTSLIGTATDVKFGSQYVAVALDGSSVAIVTTPCNNC